jgi:hypothetical protein
MREVSLPPEFAELQSVIHYVTKRGTNEFSASCPSCGGNQHSTDGAYPDRFRLFLRSRATGRPMGWCRHCGYTWHPGKLKGERWKPTPEEAAAWLSEREQYEKARLDEISRAIDFLRQETKWLKYHDNLTGELRQYYYKRGLDDYWIDYWLLGYNPCKQVWLDDASYTTPTLTIPIFETVTRQAVNLRHRLLEPKAPDDKYRPEIKGLPAAMFVADLDKPLSGQVIIIEGEFKAMTTYLTMDDPNMQVVGIPSKTPDLDLLKKLDQCDPVYICLDPDAYFLTGQDLRNNRHTTAVARLAQGIGPRARVMNLPGKVDDLIHQNVINKASLRSLMRSARKQYFA